MQPHRLIHSEQCCFSKVHIHYPSKETFYICYHGYKIIKCIEVYFKYVGMHTYKLNVLCFKEEIVDVMLAKQINRGGRN